MFEKLFERPGKEPDMAICLEHTEYGNVKDKVGWKYYCTVYLPDGRKWRPTANGKTKRIARERLEEKIAARAIELEAAGRSEETEPSEKKVDTTNTLTEQLKAYAILKQQGKVKAVGRKLKERSIDDKNELIENLIKPYKIGSIEVGKLTRKDIVEWLDKLKAAGKSEKRQKGAYNLLTDFYNNYYCLEINPSYTSPATGFRFEIKKSKADPMRIFDNDCTRLYLKACEEMGERGDILQFILYTYCREGEADTLTWSDWNQSNLIHIHRTWSKDKDGKYIVDNKPKTPDSDRYIHLPEQVVAILNARYAEVEGTEYGKPDAWIFPAVRNRHKPLSESTTMNWHREALKRAGLKHSRVHDLRHSGISFNIRNSQVDCLSALSKQAGHSSRAITESIYEHVLDSQRKELAQISSEIYNTVCPW